jgi:hypothetical protein
MAEWETCGSYHVVDAAKDPVASVPVTEHAWVVFCFVSSKILLTRESTPR